MCATDRSRKDFDSVGGFDLSLPAGEDLQLFLSLAESRQWGHVPGKPTHYRVNIGKTRGESDSISETQLSRWLIWCGIWEKHAQSFSGVVMPAKECAELMASRWHRAARECVSENNLKALAHCYRRISYWNSMERGI